MFGKRAAILDEAREARYVWFRAGREHRAIAVWVVVAEGRVFIRGYYVREGGWHQAVLVEKTGTVRFSKTGPETAVRFVRTRSERLKSAVDRAYAEKYTTASNRKYVVGFREPRRRDTTTEIVPV